MSAQPQPPGPHTPGRRTRVTRWTINPLLRHDHVWTDEQHVVASYGEGRRGVLIELNLSAGVEPDEVFARFLEAYRARLPDAQEPERLSAMYVRAVLDRQELRRMVDADQPVTPRPAAAAARGPDLARLRGRSTRRSLDHGEGRRRQPHLRRHRNGHRVGRDRQRHLP
jgi:hypothetical protein